MGFYTSVLIASDTSASGRTEAGEQSHLTHFLSAITALPLVSLQVSSNKGFQCLRKDS